MRFSSWKFVLLVALLSQAPPAHADACVDAINRFNASANRFNDMFGGKKIAMSSEAECRTSIALIQSMIPVIQDQISSLNSMRSICGARAKDMFTGVNPDKVLTNVTGHMNWCKDAIANAERTRSAPSAGPAPGAPVPAPSVARPAAPPAPAAPRSADNCSTITDSSHIGGGPCPPHRGGLRCQGATGFTACLQAAGWTTSQPYNHGKAPLVFKPFRGSEISIGPGESLFSIPDSGGRKLVPGPWDGGGDDRVGTEPEAIDETRCAQKDTNANTRKFQVSLVCEMRRQLLEQGEFARRENSYLDPTQCRGKIRLLPDYEKKTAQYWLEHPDEPVGYCDEEDRRSSATRTNSRPIREPRWLTPAECQALPTQRATPIIYNIRGIRGCKQVFQ